MRNCPLPLTKPFTALPELEELLLEEDELELEELLLEDEEELLELEELEELLLEDEELLELPPSPTQVGAVKVPL
jgi:hypothetical protein